MVTHLLVAVAGASPKRGGAARGLRVVARAVVPTASRPGPAAVIGSAAAVCEAARRSVTSASSAASMSPAYSSCNAFNGNARTCSRQCSCSVRTTASLCFEYAAGHRCVCATLSR